jgi:acyl-coenzyme A thioesterase PaaI-like protein
VAVPGFVYGGLLASLVDCHAMGMAAAASERAAGHAFGEAAMPRFVTGSLKVDFLKPTPLGPELVIRAWVTSATERKTLIAATITVDGIVTVRGEVVAVRIPASMEKPAGS